MAKSQLAKQKVRLIVGIIMMTALVLALITSSLAWFTVGKETSVQNFMLQADSAYNLQIRPTEFDNWRYEIKYDSTTKLCPVTGDGIKFFYPTFEQQKESDDSNIYHSVPTKFQALSEEELPKYVFPVDFQVKIESDCDLLIEELFVEMPKGKTNSNFETPDTGIDQVGMMGAIRIAVLRKEGSAYTPCFLWVPDQVTELQTDAEGNYTLGERSEGYEDLILQTGTKLEEQTVVKAPQTNSPYGGPMAGSGRKYAPESRTLVRFGGKQSSYSEAGGELDRITCYFDRSTYMDDDIIAHLKGQEEANFRVVLWLDGNDGECNNVLMGGEIHVGMKLGADEVE